MKVGRGLTQRGCTNHTDFSVVLYRVLTGLQNKKYEERGKLAHRQNLGFLFGTIR
jgi:hypothetical protein